MIYALLLFVTLAHSQSVSSNTKTTPDGDQTIVNSRLNTLEIATKELQNGRPVITGQPYFQNGVIWKDSTTTTEKTDTSSRTYSGGNIFVGASTFTGTVSLSSATSIGIGLGPLAGTQLNQCDFISATSIDGLTQSSGTLVILNAANGNSPVSNSYTFTTTTTANATPFGGVLMDTNIAPGAVGRICIRGLMRMKSLVSQIVGQQIFSSTTRGAGASGSVSAQAIGVYMVTDGGTWATVYVGKP